MEEQELAFFVPLANTDQYDHQQVELFDEPEEEYNAQNFYIALKSALERLKNFNPHSLD